MILELINEKPQISRSEILHKMGLHESSVKRRLKMMVDKGVIQRIGSDKGGNWQICNNYIKMNSQFNPKELSLFRFIRKMSGRGIILFSSKEQDVIKLMLEKVVADSEIYSDKCGKCTNLSACQYHLSVTAVSPKINSSTR